MMEQERRNEEIRQRNKQKEFKEQEREAKRQYEIRERHAEQEVKKERDEERRREAALREELMA
jgi:hypothetical protein